MAKDAQTTAFWGIFWEMHQIWEKTIPFDNRIDAAHELKMEKYSALCADIFQAGWICHLNAIEIGSRGLITKQNKADIRGLIKTSQETKTETHPCKLVKVSSAGVLQTLPF